MNKLFKGLWRHLCIFNSFMKFREDKQKIYFSEIRFSFWWIFNLDWKIARAHKLDNSEQKDLRKQTNVDMNIRKPRLGRFHLFKKILIKVYSENPQSWSYHRTLFLQKHYTSFMNSLHENKKSFVRTESPSQDTFFINIVFLCLIYVWSYKFLKSDGSLLVSNLLFIVQNTVQSYVLIGTCKTVTSKFSIHCY